MSAPELMAAVSNAKAAAAAQCLVDKVNNAILFPLIALLSAVAFLVFLYGCFEYVRNASNDTARQEGQRHMLYGIIGLLVMLSAYAILEIALATFGLSVDKEPCSSASNPNSSGLMSPGFATGPNGFTGGSGGSAELPPTLPTADTPPLGGGVISGAPTAPTTPTPDTPPTGSTCVVEDRVRMISCGNDASCTTAHNDCTTGYDIQSTGERGGRWQDIPPTPENGNTTWMVECTYSVAVCS